MQEFLNGHEQNGRYIHNSEIDRLSESIYSLGIQIAQLSLSQKHMADNIDVLTKHVDLINERNLKQDTIFTLLSKVWKLSPYILGIVFILTTAFTDASINISKFIEKKVEHFITN